MAIIFDENNRLITLNTKNSTYQMKIDEYDFYSIFIMEKEQTEIWIIFL